MPAPLVIAGGVALRQGAVWLGRRVVAPAGRALWSGLGRLSSAAGRTMSLSKLGNLANLLDTANKATPTHFEEVDVTVFGSPKATKRDLWRIAVAAAFGKVQRMGLGVSGVITGKSLLPPPGFIQLEYPLEGNAVRIVLRMETPYLSLLAGRTRVSREFELYTGPPDDVRGGTWGFDSVLPSVGSVAGVGAKYPKTGYEDRTLLTPSPLYRDKNGQQRASSSPHPIKDKTSRSSAPVAESAEARLLDPTNTYIEPTYLLFQALSAPCETVVQLPPQTLPPPQPLPITTDLITGVPIPLPNQNPSGTPSNDPPYDPNYQPPVPQFIPPPNSSTGPPQAPNTGLGVPVAQTAFGTLVGALDGVESSITGLPVTLGSISRITLGLGDEFDAPSNLNQAIINFGSGINSTPPISPILPPLTPPIGGGSSF
jgi:hypothetical protein